MRNCSYVLRYLVCGNLLQHHRTVCVCVCVCVHVHVCVFIYTYVYVYMQVHKIYFQVTFNKVELLS